LVEAGYQVLCKRCSAATYRMTGDLRVCGLFWTVRLGMDTVHTAITEPVRRLEVFTGAGRRRKWSDEDKARIVAKTVANVVTEDGKVLRDLANR
jgi:hypothetical protein